MNKEIEFYIIKIRCKYCGKNTEYKPKGNKIADKPRPKCRHCKKRFYISKKLIQQKIQGSTKTKTFDTKLTLWILKQLEKGLYGAQIARNIPESKDLVYKIIKWLNSKNYVIIDSNYPKKYLISHDGELYMDYLERVLKIPNKKKNQKVDTYGKIRVHEIKFQNYLKSKPQWLKRIKKNGRKIIQEKNDVHKYLFKIDIYRRDNNLKNVTYFDIQPPLVMFNYLSNISVFTNIINYTFKFPEKLQWIPFSYKAYNAYLEQCRKSCKVAREWLLSKGFEIDMADPRLAKSPSCAIDLRGKIVLGKMLYSSIKLRDGRKISFDDSLGRGDGEIEGSFDNINKIFKETPEKVEKLEREIKQIQSDNKILPKTISQVIKQDLAQFKLDFTRELTSQISKAVGESVSSAIQNLFIYNKDSNNGYKGENLFI